MKAMDVLKLRRSVRAFQDKPISNEILEKLLDAARFAPTARNIQPWEFVVVTERKTLKKLGEMAENGRFIAQAAACIAVFCSDTKYYLEDGCAATVNILTAAVIEGIGSCWVAGDKKPYCAEVAKLLNAPAALKLVSLIPLGYPESNNSFRLMEKRSLAELTHWESF